MTDLWFLLLTVGFFLLMIVYVMGCACMGCHDGGGDTVR